MVDTERNERHRTRFWTYVITLAICAAMVAMGYLLARYSIVDARPCVLLVVLLTGGAVALNHNRSSEVRRRQQVTNLRPGWKPDPCEESDNRWWDGKRFTSQIHGRVGTDSTTGQPTAVQDGVTLCPMDGKKQYLNQASAIRAANQIFESKQQSGQADYTLNRPYHHFVGRNGRGCDCWHLTSQDTQ
jgi:hypothetical protein